MPCNEAQTSVYTFFLMRGIRKATQPKRKKMLPTSPKELPTTILLAIKRMLHTRKITHPRS